MAVLQPITKERLKEYVWLKKEIETQKERLEHIRSQLTSFQSPNLDGMPRSSFDFDRMAEAMAKIDELERLIMKKPDEHQTECNEILEAISEMPDSLERQLLRLRYIDGLDWFDIYERLNYEHAQTHRIHARALKNILEISEKLCKNTLQMAPYMV
jgi:DNA-directed RNA polymerase specialized sigma subunit